MKKAIFTFSIALLVIIAMVSSCKKQAIRETTTTDVNILQYLQQDSLQRFTSLVAIIYKVGYNDFLNAYGTYTLFAPTNDAVAAYLKQVGKTSIDQIQISDLQNLLKFHLLTEVVYSSQFNDGKLPSVTMYGQFLITGVANKGGVSSYIINRQGTVLQANIKLGNGIIHVIDQVLIPTAYSLAQLVEQNPDYSIFLQALKATGYYDTLNLVKNPDSSAHWLTLIAETNKDYTDTGITSYAALKAKYSNTGNPLLATDSLHLYVAYHILKDIKYLADIVTASSHETLAPLQVVTDLVSNNKVLLNDDTYSTINGTVHEVGGELELANSDVSATNGVMHRILKHLAIKVRSPFPVYWDLCATQTELTRLSTVYRKSAAYLFDRGDSTNNAFKDIKWSASCLKYRYSGNGYLGDYWELGLGTSTSNTSNTGTCSSNTWIEFTTPLLVAGKYKVWFCYYTQNSTVSAVQGSFDGVPLTSALIQFHQKISSVNVADEASLAAIGWKWWAGVAKKSGSTAARMLGIIDIQLTGRHKIRFDLLSGTNSDCNFDMVQFIPIGMSQTSPHFNPDGTTEP